MIPIRYLRQASPGDPLPPRGVTERLPTCAGLAWYTPRLVQFRRRSLTPAPPPRHGGDRRERLMTELIVGAHESDTHQKALRINLDPRWYGTVAEIGAGQEVVRWFFRVGGAAGTVAMSISMRPVVSWSSRLSISRSGS